MLTASSICLTDNNFLILITCFSVGSNDPDFYKSKIGHCSQCVETESLIKTNKFRRLLLFSKILCVCLPIKWHHLTTLTIDHISWFFCMCLLWRLSMYVKLELVTSVILKNFFYLCMTANKKTSKGHTSYYYGIFLL